MVKVKTNITSHVDQYGRNFENRHGIIEMPEEALAVFMRVDPAAIVLDEYDKAIEKVEAPVEVAVEAPVEIPAEVETPVEVVAEAPAEIPTEAPAEAPAEEEATAEAPVAKKKKGA